MEPPAKRRLAIAAVLAIALAAGGAAFAASRFHGSTSPSRFTAAPRQQQPGGGQGFGFGRRDGGDGFGFDGRGLGGRFGLLQAAASYLGVSTSDLTSQLASGKTLAQIASANGKSASGLVDAIVSAQRTQIEGMVSSGQVTRAQADQLESGLKARVTAQVNGSFGGRGFGPGGFRGRDDGDGRFGGPGGRSPGTPPTQTTPSVHI